MNDLKNKVAYITGGSKGIGFGIASKLLKAGMKVAISSRLLENAEKAAKELGQEENVLAIASDVSKLGDEILGKTKILKKTSTLIFLFCELSCHKKIIASASGIWKIIKIKPSNFGPGG